MGLVGRDARQAKALRGQGRATARGPRSRAALRRNGAHLPFDSLALSYLARLSRAAALHLGFSRS
jgi:hypothetical protein